MSSSVIRYLQSPSIFWRTEDKQWGEIVHKNLRPREQDEGKTSFWEHSNEQEKRYVLAASAARTRKKERIMAVSLSKQLFENAGVELLDDCDEENFTCIANLHRSGLLEDEDARTRLLHEIRNSFGSDGVEEVKMSKSEVEELVVAVIEECENIEWKKAGDWASRLVPG